MSTTLAAPADTNNRVIEYTPFGESKPIKLSLAIVRSHIAVPTKKGNHPSDSELMKFIMLCQARELNPWVGDAYLVGYDSQDGPKFSLITAIQALLKRAEVNPEFDGLESGVIVERGNGDIKERLGDLLLNGEKLVGGWAKCYRKDRSVPFSEALNLGTYNTGRSQWAKDPAGMIVKCAEASVLRKAFPSQVGSLYIEQERGAIERREGHVVEEKRPQTKKLTAITDEITGKVVQNGERFSRTAEETQEVYEEEVVSSGGPVADGEPETVYSQTASESQDSEAAATFSRERIAEAFGQATSETDCETIRNYWLEHAPTDDDRKWLEKTCVLSMQAMGHAKKRKKGE